MVLEVEDRDLTSVPQLVGGARRRGGRFMYYRQPSGYVVAAESHEAERMRHIAHGWQELRKYGVFLWDEWSLVRPLDHLFLRGGAKELPYAQLIEESYAYPIWGANHNQPYVAEPCGAEIDKRPCCGGKEPARVHFPQLDTRPVPPLVQCNYCDRMGTQPQIENHQDAAHAKDAAPHRVAELIAKGMRGEPQAQTSTMPYICGKCGTGFSGHMQLARHVKEHKNDG